MSEETTVVTGPGLGEFKPPEPTAETQRRYTVLHAHAKGGLGEVVVARDLELHRLTRHRESVGLVKALYFMWSLVAAVTAGAFALMFLRILLAALAAGK